MSANFARILSLLDPAQKKRGMFIVILLVICAFLDFLSLAFFLPVILILISPSVTDSPGLIASLQKFSGLNSDRDFIIAMIIGSLLFILIKNKINVWITSRKARFAYSVANHLSMNAVRRYLNFTYADYAKTDRSQELNRITNIPLMFANNIIIPAGTLLSESLVAIILLSGLAVYDIKAFVLVLLILLPAGLVHFQKRKKTKAISNKLGDTHPQFLKRALEIIDGLIDIKSFRKQQHFKTRADEKSGELGDLLAQSHVSQTSIVRSTEVIAALGICALLIYSVTAKSGSETLVLLSIYSGASFRIIPSINKIFLSAHLIRVNDHVVDDLMGTSSLTTAENMEQQAVAFLHSLKLENVAFSHDIKEPMLRRVNLMINKGERIVITGKSGAGKSTLLHILAGFITPQSGNIIIDGRTVSSLMGFQSNICYVSQQPFIQDASILQNIGFGLPEQLIDLNRIQEVLKQTDLSEWINSLPEKYNTRIGEHGAKISGGQRQRIAIARALYPDPPILIFDEVTNQLDHDTAQEVMNTLLKVAQQNKTIIMVTHQQQLWKRFDSVYELDKGVLSKVSTEVEALKAN
jgi:ATP-binding cassette, subfamily B, bacterial PglK